MGHPLDKNAAAVRKQLEAHTFQGEDGEEYGPSKFGEFGDYFRKKKIKLQNEDYLLRQSVPGKPQIFKGVVVHVASYTQPTPEELRRMIVIHGGGHIKYLDYKTMVTHIVATTLPPKKADEWRRLRVVRPAWIVDSIAAGKLLPWTDYQIIGAGPQQKRIQFHDGKLAVQEAQADQMAGYREQSKDSYYTEEMRQFAAKHTSHGRTELPWIESETTSESHGDGLEEDKMREERPVSSPSKVMTAEEYNAQLLSDPNIRKTSAANPEFLKQFYSESRLHHLSTWKAELKSKMQRLAAEKGATTGAGSGGKRKTGGRRYIMHVDFDSFFCAVSLKSAPEYADKPAAVAHSTGDSSEIASCNYPARQFGVKNGMWMKRATELCPDLKVLPYDFPAYEEASRLFYEAIIEVGGVVQSVSVDEALVDVTDLVTTGTNSGDESSARREQAAADDIATGLRQRIRQQTGCHVSVGIGGNILVAKVALRRAKPAGQVQVRPDEVLEVLGGLAVEQLLGVAHSIGGRLAEMGVQRVSDLRGVSRERLVGVVGRKTGERLWEQARGIDGAEVGEQPGRKSVSAEVNWGIRFVHQAEAEEFVLNLCRELERRLLHEQVRGRQLTLKILRRAADAPLEPEKHLGHGRCDTFSKSAVFGVATHRAEATGREAVALLRSFHFRPGDLRGLGVQMQKLEPLRSTAADGSQPRLTFAEAEKKEPRQKRPRESPVLPSTQFVLPRDVDPSVLAALPADIRRRLVEEPEQDGSSRRDGQSSPGKTKAAVADPVDDLPPDIDREVLDALPEDVRAEVLAEYRQRQSAQQIQPAQQRPPVQQKPAAQKPAAQQRQTLSPSPRKGKGRMAGPGKRSRPTTKRVPENFFGVPAAATGSSSGQQEDMEEPDPEVLAALPEDIRAEVLADYERRRLARQQQEMPRRDGDGGEQGQKTLQFPTAPAKTGFRAVMEAASQSTATTASPGHVLSLQEAKDLIRRWHEATDGEGPHEADVAVLGRYLAGVVTNERDMDKARKLISWLEWLVDEEPRSLLERESWQVAVDGLKEAVQEAMAARGLGPMKFG